MNESQPARPETTIPQDEFWLVRATENITVAPMCRLIVMGKLEAGRGQKLPPLVCFEPAQVPIEGILSARGLSRVVKTTLEPPE
jgi:hypothetical protein